MDDPMADDGELGLTADILDAAVVNRRDRALVIIADDRPLGEAAPLRVRYGEPRCCPYSLDLPMSRGRDHRSAPVTNTENLMLEDPAFITRIGSCMRLTSRDGPGITLHSPQTRNRPMSPGMPPGKSSTRAVR